jgi:hypothetical protein
MNSLSQLRGLRRTAMVAAGRPGFSESPRDTFSRRTPRDTAVAAEAETV